MFYTKYRPQKFSEISKPNDSAEALAVQIRSKKPVHAYLFVGSRGTGKTTTARILAKALNCLEPLPNGDPCDECKNCKAIKAGNFMDLIEIDAASNRGVDDIRDLKDKVKLAPAHGNKKVYIIDEVHMLTMEAFNALLKTLEEPPKHVVFILCTTELHKVPDTIKSRCQVFKFKRATMEQLVAKLKKICAEEGAEVEKQTLSLIAQSAFGGFRDAETLLQQIVEGSISPESLLGANSRQSYIDFVDFLLERDARSAINLVNKIFEDGVDLSVWVGELLKYFRELLFIKSGAATESLEFTEDLKEKIEIQSLKVDDVHLSIYIQVFVRVPASIKSSVIPQLPLEVAIFDLCNSIGTTQNEQQSEGEMPLRTANKASSEISTGAKSVKDVKDEAKRAGKDIKPEAKPEKKSETANSNRIPTLSLETVKEKWGEVVTMVAAINSSIQTLVKQGRILDVTSEGIQMEVSYAFHKERLENPKNRRIVEDALMKVFGIPQTIKCIVNTTNRPAKGFRGESGSLTDYNVLPVSLATAPVSVIEMFDGGLPLGK